MKLECGWCWYYGPSRCARLGSLAGATAHSWAGGRAPPCHLWFQAWQQTVKIWGWGAGWQGVYAITLPLGGLTSAAQLEVNKSTNDVKGEAEKGDGDATKVVMGT